MVVQVVGQVVGHQVLARDAHVHRVPVLKLPPQLLQVLLGDGSLGEGRRLEEDEVPHPPGHLLWPGGQGGVGNKTGVRVMITDIHSTNVNLLGRFWLQA